MRFIRASLCCLFLFAALDVSAQIAVRAERIHTAAGPVIEQGVILIQDGKIHQVGPASDIRIPDNYRVLEATVVTPGLIDAHSVVGLSGYLNQPHDQDQLETSAPIQPELRAIDAYNPREALVEWVRGFGITTIHTGHGPGAVISGQTLIAKTSGETVDDAVMVPAAMVAATLGNGARASGGKAPGTRSKMVAMLRAELIKARAYADKRAEHQDDGTFTRDLRMETLAAVLDGEMPLLVTVERAHDILTTIRLAQEFGIRLVLDSAAEAHLVLDEIKESGFPVISHATMARHSGERENATFEQPARLRGAGIPFALQSGYEAYVPKTRVVLFEAGVAAAHGLSFDEALASVTMDAARILGIQERVGSIEVGKDADLALFDGDPFEYTTHCTGVIIDGVVVSEEIR
ncbi:MAG: amidohydrolase family protein [Rhodothermales bacterium]